MSNVFRPVLDTILRLPEIEFFRQYMIEKILDKLFATVWLILQACQQSQSILKPEKENALNRCDS